MLYSESNFKLTPELQQPLDKFLRNPQMDGFTKSLRDLMLDYVSLNLAGLSKEFWFLELLDDIKPLFIFLDRIEFQQVNGIISDKSKEMNLRELAIHANIVRLNKGLKKVFIEHASDASSARDDCEWWSILSANMPSLINFFDCTEQILVPFYQPLIED